MATFPYDPNEFSAGPEIDSVYTGFPDPATPTANPAPQGEGLGLGNNLETWLAGLTLLGGAMQPIRVGDSAGGVAGRALAGAAQMFGNVKGAKAKGAREDRELDVKSKQADATLAETKRQDVETNPNEQADIMYKQALTWATMNPQAGVTKETIAQNKFVEAYKAKNKGTTDADAILTWEAMNAKNPEQLGQQQLNTAVTAQGAGAGLGAQDILPTITDPGIQAATQGYKPLPNVGDPVEMQKLQTLLSSPAGIKLAVKHYGPGIVDYLK